MSKTNLGFRRGAISWTVATGVAVVVTIVLAVLVSIGKEVGREPAQASDRGLSISLAVEPFEVGDSVGARWNAVGFADSLATRLSMVQGIHASTATAGNDARYVLYGTVAMKDGRLVLATRLGRGSERDTVWTATFWRSTTSGTTVLSDLATAVAEAVLGETAREALTPKGEKR